jgi:hypothetical protein
MGDSAMSILSYDMARRAYVEMRRRGYGAAEAKRQAIGALLGGRKFYGSDKIGGHFGGRGTEAPADRRNAKGGIWIETPAALGLRFVGFADELPGGPKETGWYDDAYQESVYRGAVWQWPARKGESLYVYGWRHGAERRGKGWQDDAYLSDHGAGKIDFSEMVKGDKGGRERDAYDADADLRDCARWANSMAESDAEESRDYSEAYEQGRKAAELLGEAGEARRAALAIIREAKGACPALASIGEAMRAAIGEKIEESIEAWRDAKREAAKLADDVGRYQAEAFAAGLQDNRA